MNEDQNTDQMMPSKKTMLSDDHSHLSPGGVYGWLATITILLVAGFAVTFYVIFSHRLFEAEIDSFVTENNGAVERKSLRGMMQRKNEEMAQQIEQEQWSAHLVDMIAIPYPFGWHVLQGPLFPGIYVELYDTPIEMAEGNPASQSLVTIYMSPLEGEETLKSKLEESTAKLADIRVDRYTASNETVFIHVKGVRKDDQHYSEPDEFYALGYMLAEEPMYLLVGTHQGADNAEAVDVLKQVVDRLEMTAGTELIPLPVLAEMIQSGS